MRELSGHPLMSQDDKTKLHQFQVDYAQPLLGNWAAIEAQWHTLSQYFDKPGVAAFHHVVHSLHEASSTCGYVLISQMLRDLEVYLEQLLNYQGITTTQKNEVSHLIERIKNTLQMDQKPLLGKTEFSHRVIDTRLILYLVGEKENFEHELQTSLRGIGYKLILLKTVDDLQATIKKQLPAAIILDELHFEDKRINELDKLRQYYQVTLLCIVKKDDLDTRLKSIRAGVTIFLRKPVNVFYLTNRLVQLCGLSRKEMDRILILESSESLATYYALILEEAGMNVHAITDPAQLMHELQDFNPRLLLLDLYFPGCTGFDLARVVRQEERYASLPIVCVSTESDRYKQLAILNDCGGDDFLTKPVLPQNLIAAVKSRAQRTALLVSYIIQDGLTNLLNHSYSLTQLELEIARAHREHHPIVVAMLDLDDFKRVNDTYGHPIGDMVLKKLARFMSDMLRHTDFIGRYGGEEFIIIFPNTNLTNAVRLCNKIREKFSAHSFKAEGLEFNVTLSAGLADYPTHQTVDALIAAADRALYQAKLKGRNRILF